MGRPGPSPPANVTGERDYLTEGEVEQLMQASRVPIATAIVT